MSLTTAEGITRFLRSKDALVAEIIATAEALVSGRLEANLPNKTTFVLDLLCDRLTDNKSEKFRLEPSAWALLGVVWKASSASAHARAVRSLKVVDLVVTTLAQAPRALDPVTLVEVALATAKTVLDDFYQQTPESVGLTLLARFLGLLSAIEAPAALVEGWTEIVAGVYNTSVLGAANAKMSKKLITTFAGTCAGPLLNLLGGDRVTPATRVHFEAFVTRTLFHRDTGVPNLKHNLGVLLKQSPSEVALVVLFETTLNLLFKSDFALCEEVFTIITTAVPTLTELLLARLARSNRPLSPEFLHAIMEAEFARSPQNWVLISHLMELDADLALEYGPRIFTLLATSDVAEGSGVHQSLLAAYINAREFPAFFERWAEGLAVEAPVNFWGREFFTLLVAARVKELTANQLERLVALLTAAVETNVIPLTAIVQGLFDGSDKNIQLVRSALLQPVAAPPATAEFWRLQYNLLCLYRDADPVELLRLVEVAKATPKNEFVFYTLFRIRELVEYNLDDVTSQFLAFLKKAADPGLLERTMDRWMVFLDRFASPEALKDTAVAVLATPEPQFLVRLFKNPVLYEQRAWCGAMVGALAASVESTPEVVVPLLLLVPVQCLSKFHRVSLINSLTKLARAATPAQAPAILGAISHLLSQPSFLAEIETKVDIIYDLLVPTSGPLVVDLFVNLWTHRVNQMAEKQNSEFVEATMVLLTKFLLEHRPSAVVPPQLRVALAILSHSPRLAGASAHPAFVALREAFIQCVDAALRQAPEAWYLDALYTVEHDRSNERLTAVRELVKRVGRTVTLPTTAALDPAMAVALFQLSSLSASTVYLMALYLSLRSSLVGVFSLSMAEAFGSHLARLTPEAFALAFETLLGSLEETTLATQQSTEHHVELLVTCFRNFPKTEQAAELFVHALSTLMGMLQTQSHLFSSKAAVLLLASIKALLVDSAWLLTQYLVELMLAMVTLIAARSPVVEVYVLCTQVVSNVLLFHRYRLSNRNHLLVSTFVVLMDAIALKKGSRSAVTTSTTAAKAYARLLGNLCEPQANPSHNKQALTSTNSLIKRLLRKHVPVLLINFVHTSLKHLFDPMVRVELLPGIYNVFDVLSSSELSLVSASLDMSGKVFYKALTSDYKKFGKWKDE